MAKAAAQSTPSQEWWRVEDAWVYLTRVVKLTEHRARIDLLTAMRRGDLQVRCNGRDLPPHRCDDLTFNIENGRLRVQWGGDELEWYPWLVEGGPLANDYTVPTHRMRVLWRPTPHQQLTAAVEKRIEDGFYPGASERWERFCDEVRKACGVDRSERGYGDKTIKRIVRGLKDKGLSHMS